MNLLKNRHLSECNYFVGATRGRVILIWVSPKRPKKISFVLYLYTEDRDITHLCCRISLQRDQNVLVVYTETYLNLNLSQLCNNELHWMRWSEATLNSSHFQISVKKRKIIPCICIHKISRKSAQFSPLPPPDYTNRPFYILQKLIHFRVQMSGTTTAVPKFDATCTKKKKGFLAFTFNLNL